MARPSTHIRVLQYVRVYARTHTRTGSIVRLRERTEGPGQFRNSGQTGVSHGRSRRYNRRPMGSLNTKRIQNNNNNKNY